MFDDVPQVGEEVFNRADYLSPRCHFLCFIGVVRGCRDVAHGAANEARSG